MNIYGGNELHALLPRKQLSFGCGCPPPSTCPGLMNTGTRDQTLEFSHWPGLVSATWG